MDVSSKLHILYYLQRLRFQASYVLTYPDLSRQIWRSIFPNRLQSCTFKLNFHNRDLEIVWSRVTWDFFVVLLYPVSEISWSRVSYVLILFLFDVFMRKLSCAIFLYLAILLHIHTPHF